jgi:hypothetical protein
MQFGFLFKKTSTCYGDPDIEYLDETSEKKLQIQAEKNGVSVEEYIQKNNQVQKDIEYLTKEDHGKVYAAGYLRNMLLAPKVQAPEKWDNEVRKTKITEAITDIVEDPNKGRYRGAIGHKLIFSVSTEMEEKIESAGLNLDEILRKECKRVMTEFQHEFHKGDQIGYAFGIHHDTNHRHMHIFLSNRTSKGKHVAMSNPLKNHTNRKYVQKDQIGFIKKRLVLAQLRIEKQCAKKIKNVQDIKIESIKVKPETEKERIAIKNRKTKKAGSLKFSPIKEEALNKQQIKLMKKQKELLSGKDEIRELYAEYNIRKDLINTGMNNIDRINELISLRFKDLKKLKAPIPTSMLRKFGYLSNNGFLKFMSKSVAALSAATTDKARNNIFKSINASKEIKQRIYEQVKIQKKERNRFLDMIKEVKKENARKQKEFYKNLYLYRKNLEKYNVQKFLDDAKNTKTRYEYFSVLKSLKSKKKAGKDYSRETEYLKYFKMFVNKQESKSETSEDFVRSQFTANTSQSIQSEDKYVSLKERAQMNRSRVNPNSILNRNNNNNEGVSYD